MDIVEYSLHSFFSFYKFLRKSKDPNSLEEKPCTLYHAKDIEDHVQANDMKAKHGMEEWQDGCAWILRFVEGFVKGKENKM